MENMGFHSTWRGWVMKCVTTAYMSILIYGSPSTPFKLQIGLRQGDPLSPFLFLLVADVFNKMVTYAKGLGYIEGITIGRDTVELSHLQFADDPLFFSLASASCLKNYRCMLACFSLMSGLNVNYSKSALIAFGCEDSWVEDISSLL